MAWFSSNRYSQTEEYLSEEWVRRHINNIHVPTMHNQPEQERLIQDTLLARRRGDGKISLHQAYEALTQLKNKNQISKYDRDGVMKLLLANAGKTGGNY